MIREAERRQGSLVLEHTDWNVHGHCLVALWADDCDAQLVTVVGHVEDCGGR